MVERDDDEKPGAYSVMHPVAEEVLGRPARRPRSVSRARRAPESGPVPVKPKRTEEQRRKRKLSEPSTARPALPRTDFTPKSDPAASRPDRVPTAPELPAAPRTDFTPRRPADTRPAPKKQSAEARRRADDTPVKAVTGQRETQSAEARRRADDTPARVVTKAAQPITQAPTARRPKSGSGHAAKYIERAQGGGITAIGTASIRPPAPPPRAPIDRARKIVKALRSCGPDDEGPALQSLLQIGSHALEAVAEDFPGLLWFHRSLSHKKVPRGRDTGPLARILIAFGEASIPYVESFVRGDLDQRYYAVLIAAELRPSVSSESRNRLVAALGARLRDPEREVADLALSTLLDFEGDPALDALAAVMRQKLSTDMDPTERLFAVRTLGVLRRGDSARTIISALDDTNSKVVDAAVKVLRLVAAEDFTSRKKWDSWLDANISRDRLEWLTDGLTHRNAAIRTIAHRELSRVFPQDLGYTPEASRRFRKAKQTEYRRLVEDWLADRAVRLGGPMLPS